MYIIITSHDYCIGSLYIYYVYVVKLGFLSSFMGISPENCDNDCRVRPIQVSVLKSPEKKGENHRFPRKKREQW